MITWNTKTSTL